MPKKPRQPDSKPDPNAPKHPSRVENVEIDGAIFTTSPEAAKALRELIASGQFTGFRGDADEPPK
jgi:acyl dehydratase